MCTFIYRRKPTRQTAEPTEATPAHRDGDIIFAYGSNSTSSNSSMMNLTFEEDSSSPPPPLDDFPSEVNSVTNHHYIGPLRSWRGLVPIDERPEIIYTQCKDTRKHHKSGLSKSKSLDDICAKIGSKVKKKKKKVGFGDLPASHSVECIPNDHYENVIMPHYATQHMRRQSGGLSIDPTLYNNCQPNHSTAAYEICRVSSLRQTNTPPSYPYHNHAYDFQTTNTLPTRQHRRRSSYECSDFPIGHSPNGGILQLRPTSYDSLVLDGSGATLQHNYNTTPKSYETMLLHSQTEDEVAL